MKKYTIYEIEKLTDGKLSKYKLNRAIAEGDLTAETVKSDKKGRGGPKFYVTENNLQAFLQKVEAQKKTKINFPNQPESAKESSKALKKVMDNLVTQKDELLSKQDETIQGLLKRVQTLESVKVQLNSMPDRHEIEAEKMRSNQRRELILELANMTIFAFNKRKKVLKDLNRLC